MKAYHIDRFGSVGGIVRRSSEDPRPGPKEILMRVCASSLNYRDLMVLKGGGRGPTKIGVVPLSDGAGEVAAIGEGVTRVKIGDRIAGCFHPRWLGGPIPTRHSSPTRNRGVWQLLPDLSDPIATALPLFRSKNYHPSRTEPSGASEQAR